MSPESSRKFVEQLKTNKETFIRVKTNDARLRELLREAAIDIEELEKAVARDDRAEIARCSRKTDLAIGALNKRLGPAAPTRAKKMLSDLHDSLTRVAKDHTIHPRGLPYTGKITGHEHRDGRDLVIQESGGKRVEHDIRLFKETPAVGETVTITYDDEHRANVKQNFERSRTGERTRTRTVEQTS